MFVLTGDNETSNKKLKSTGGVIRESYLGASGEEKSKEKKPDKKGK